MTDEELAFYKGYLRGLDGVQMILERNKYPNPLTDERKAIDQEFKNREKTLELDDESLEIKIMELENYANELHAQGKGYRQPYIYYLMKYELRKRREELNKRRGL